MLAGMPMYDLEALREATDAWWRGIAAALERQGFDRVPDTLDRGAFGDRFALWASPDLLLAQTCGYPLTHDFADRVRLVATPCYATPHCVGPDYCSVVAVAEDHPAVTIGELRGGRVAVNGFDSQSGFNALRALVAPLARNGRFFAETIETGRHAASLRAVAEGRAEVCAVDCVAHALWTRHMPEVVAGTRVLTLTARAPGLPYITRGTASDEEVARLQAALLEAAADPRTAAVRRELMIDGFALLPRQAYDRIDAMERDAAAAGYPDLA